MACVISVAEARRPEAIGREVVVQGWVRTRRDSKAGLQLLGTQRRLLVRQRASDRRRQPAELRVGNQAGSRPAVACSVAGVVKRLARQGPGHRSPRHDGDGPRHGRRGDAIRCRRRATRWSSCARSPICGRGPTPSGPSPGCETASATRSTSSSRSGASSTSTRRSSPPAIAKGPGPCSRSPRSWTKSAVGSGQWAVAEDRDQRSEVRGQRPEAENVKCQNPKIPKSQDPLPIPSPSSNPQSPMPDPSGSISRSTSSTARPI